MYNQLQSYLRKPHLYAPSTDAFWDDEHISKGMLEAHLSPYLDAATRRHEFIDSSVQWITQIAPPAQYTQLLDLGCGPGLYAQRFHNAGYSVTGLDFSRRSIAYAQDQAQRNQSNIAYFYQNYMTMEYADRFDVITMIYCDYAALSRYDRKTLMQKVYHALKKNGKFLFDVFTPRMRKPEGKTWSYHENGGFYRDRPHLCLESIYQYDDEDETELRQSIVVTEETVHCYHIWDHFFSEDQLQKEIQAGGFQTVDYYGDVAGKTFSSDSATICCICTK